MKLTIFASLSVLFIAASASASTYVLDFDADPNNAAEVASLDSSLGQGFANPRVFLDAGVQWEVMTGGGVGAGLFDTTCSYGVGPNGCSGDPDLEVTNQANTDNVAGNVLIQQEPNSNPNTMDVDDDVNTRRIDLKLLTDITLDWTGASAVDDGYYRFNFGATELGAIAIASDNQTGSTVFANAARISQHDVISVFFDVAQGRPNSGASGAVDHFTFDVVPPVPVPASLPLLLAGVGAFAAMRRRKRG